MTDKSTNVLGTLRVIIIPKEMQEVKEERKTGTQNVRQQTRSSRGNVASNACAANTVLYPNVRAT